MKNSKQSSNNFQNQFKKDKKMKCAVYVRTNSHQDNRLTLKDQKELCETFIKSRGWSLHSIYQDTGSGTSIDLPNLQLLLKESSEKKFDVVIVKCVSRFSRKLNLINGIFNYLYSHGVQVLSIDENPFLQSSHNPNSHS